ncbi:MAG TPA: aminopeptidase, partial [Chitinophagaceae bacterium]|nr:aminopeptidase [Chitinophagaceae bacterium]
MIKSFRPYVLGFTVLLGAVEGSAQTGVADFSVKEVERIERFLASDEMRGRRAGSPEIEKAAAFIADEFKKAGLQPVQGTSYLQEFTMIRPRMKELKYKAEGADVDARNIVVITSKPELEVDEKSGFEVRTIKAGGNFPSEVSQMNAEKKNLIIYVDTSFSRNFSRLTGLKRQMFSSPYSKVFILGTTVPKE